MEFLKGLLKYSGLLMLSGWMFFMGVLVGRGTAPVEFDTGWFQERLAVIFDDSEITAETVAQKPELDFYAALQKSDSQEDYDLQIKKTPASQNGKDGKSASTSLSENLSYDVALSDTQAPLKRSRKAMTKLGSKQPTSSLNDDAIGKSDFILAKSDKIKIASKIQQVTDSQYENSESENNSQTASLKTSSKFSQIKALTNQQLPETKSEQVKEYAQKVYSYTIQIASFNNENDAITHISKLGEKGYSAYKISGTVGDKTWYRIRIGDFNNITEAKESLKKLESSGIKGLIIQKD
ncbi:MAG: SPOR domain-containing protein [Desulfamplus sp.]|nr:SPOR domain-containing protein [Desulfamplus sp.]